jgi:hypothetical protein
MLDHLFQLLTPYLLHLFPSTRLASVLPPGSNSAPIDIIDQPVWQFLAALALHASAEQQQILVATLREKVLENISNAKRNGGAENDESWTKLANVNLFLNALGIQFSGDQFVFKSCQFCFSFEWLCPDLKLWFLQSNTLSTNAMLLESYLRSVLPGFLSLQELMLC